MIIDIHSHGLNGKYLDPIITAGGSAAKKVIEGELERAKNRPQYLDVNLRIEQLDRYGFDMQVVTVGNHLDVAAFPVDAATRIAAERPESKRSASREDKSPFPEDACCHLLSKYWKRSRSPPPGRAPVGGNGQVDGHFLTSVVRFRYQTPRGAERNHGE